MHGQRILAGHTGVVVRYIITMSVTVVPIRVPLGVVGLLGLLGRPTKIPLLLEVLHVETATTSLISTATTASTASTTTGTSTLLESVARRSIVRVLGRCTHVRRRYIGRRRYIVLSVVSWRGLLLRRGLRRRLLGLGCIRHSHLINFHGQTLHRISISRMLFEMRC